MRVFRGSALVFLLLSGCSAPAPLAPSPKAPGERDTLQTQGSRARDYYFPSSLGMRAIYALDYLTELATESMTSTGSLTVEVISYAPTRAILKMTSLEEGDVEPFVATSSLTVEPDGAVLSEGDGTLRYSDAIFSSGGGILAAASGSEIPEFRARMVGTEALSTPAGSFATVKLLQTIGEPGAPATLVWVAKGIGIVRRSTVYPLSPPLSPTETKMGTASVEMHLISLQR